MLKKSLIVFSIFCAILLISNMCFATNMIEDTKSNLDKAGQGMSDMVSDAKSGVKNMADDIKTGAEDVTDTVRDDADSMKQDMSENHDYTVSQTGVTSSVNSNSSMTFVWFILAIAAIAIIALVWYYTVQTENHR